MTLQTRLATRTAASVLVEQLRIQRVTHVFCVPGESYLPVLDALYDSGIAVTVCRNEGGASMMAEAWGKQTGRPGICFVTRGPGATNGSGGIHIAQQDSTPMILFVGQVERENRGRDAFQEVDYRAFFGGMAKWVAEVNEPDRMAEMVARAFSVAMAGRQGPVAVGIRPEKIRLGRTDENALTGEVMERAYIGVSTQYIVETRNGNVTVVVLNDRPGAVPHSPGDHLTLSWDPEATFVVDPMEEAE